MTNTTNNIGPELDGATLTSRTPTRQARPGLLRERIMAKSQREVGKLLDEAGFVGVDVNMTTSFFEYGLAVNTKTGLVLYSRPTVDCPDEDAPLDSFAYGWTRIDQDDIESALAGVEDGFYSCIGSPRDEYIATAKRVGRDFWPIAISDLNAYNGSFDDSCEFDASISEIVSMIVDA